MCAAIVRRYKDMLARKGIAVVPLQTRWVGKRFGLDEGDAGDEQGLARAMELLKQHNAISDTVARARHYGEIARDALAPLPDGALKQALLEVVEFCVSRVN